MVEDDKKPEEVKKPERADFLKEARELAEKNQRAVEEMRELVNRNEEIAAKGLLGGKSDAGRPQDKPAEETPADYANKALSGQLNEKRND
jgi:hypothetical protein